MTTTIEGQTQDQVEKLRWLNQAIDQATVELAQTLAKKIEDYRAEITKAEVELTSLDPRIFAKTMHVFTLVFKGGQMALVEVYGAPSEYLARERVAYAFKRCEYTVLNEDQGDGRASGTYRCWYNRAAQEVHTHRLMGEELQA